MLKFSVWFAASSRACRISLLIEGFPSLIRCRRLVRTNCMARFSAVSATISFRIASIALSVIRPPPPDGPISRSGARFGIWISSNRYSRLPNPAKRNGPSYIAKWTRILGTGRARTAPERLEGVIDRGLQNRTDAEEAARREPLQDAAQHWS